MEHSAEALARFDRETNAVNPEDKINILSARLLQLNTEYTLAQGDRVRREAALGSIKSGSLEAAQVSGQGDALGPLISKLHDVRQHLAELETSYGKNHPEVRKGYSVLAEVQKQVDETRNNIAGRITADYRQALAREDTLKKAVADTKADYDRVNFRSFEYERLKREADADKNLYDELIHKINEAGINAGFQNHNIRIADVALPGTRPVYPNLIQNVVIALMFASILAVGTSSIVDGMDTKIRDSEGLARVPNADLLGTLPENNDPFFPEAVRILRNMTCSETRVAICALSSSPALAPAKARPRSRCTSLRRMPRSQDFSW